MPQNKNSKLYDLEDRTLDYSKRLLKLLFKVPKNIINNNLVNQVSRSGTSMGANYREANETETKKDFVFRIRICRKEAKETIYWLELLLDVNPSLEKEIIPFMQEAQEFVKIFAAIILKSK
jgi:four helix bundle protein